MNTAECTFEIEVIDVQDPIIGCPQDVTISTDAGVCEWASQAGSLSPIVAIENCEPNLQWSVENPDGSTAADSGDVSGYVFELGESVVTYTLSDSSGVQLAACNFRVTVEDNESPEIAGCNDLGLYFFGSAEISADDGLCSATPTLPPVIVTDNCSSELEADLIITRSDGLIVTETLTQLVVFGTPTPFYFSSPELLVGVNTIEVVVRDESGNESRCIGQIVVTDDEEPTITCSVLDPAYNTDLGSCDYTVQGDEFDPMVGDNCTVESVSNDYNATSSLANAVFPVGSTTVVWTVTDESGNTATCEITVVVEDNETPVFVNCPGDTITVGNDFSNCSGGVNWSQPIAADNCEMSVAQTAGPTPGDILDVGNYTVTYIATDDAGNTAECTFTIEVLDVQDPIIGCPQDVTISTDAGVCEWASQAGSLSPIVAIENCEPNLQWSVENPDGSVASDSGDVSGYVFLLGESTVTYTLSDSTGAQVDECSFRVTVEDTEAPVISCPMNESLSASAGDCFLTLSPELTDVEASDNCTVFGDLDISYEVQGTDNSLSGSLANGTDFDFSVGISQVTFTVVDESGNVSECTYTVEITDDENPTVTCPADLTYAVSDDGQPGNCGVVADIVIPHPEDNCGITQLVYSVFLPDGSVAGAIDLSYVYSDPGLFGTETVLDFYFPVGAITVNILGEDASGYQIICSYTVTVEDDEAPSFVICPVGPITVGNDFSNCEGGVNWSIPIATDNCEVSVAQTAGPTAGDILDVGNYTVTYIATDGNMNTAECTFEIEVIDVQDPIIGCPQDLTISTDADVCEWASQAGSLSPIVAIENCEPNLQWSVENPDGSTAADSGDVSGYVFGLGVSTVTYTLTDSSGVQLDECSFRVTVEDTEAPVVSCPMNEVLSASAGDCFLTLSPELTDVEASDNCTVFGDLDISYKVQGPDNSLSGSLANGTDFDFAVGISQVTFTVVDEAGNESTCTYTVEITDDEVPMIECAS